MSVQTSIGSLILDSCIYNASGPRCTTLEELLKLDSSESALVLSKSSTLEKRDGNEKPRYYNHDLGSINSMGLPNLGYQYYINNGNSIVKPYIISVNGLTLDDTKVIVRNIILSQDINGIEINLSCPNIIGKGQLAYDLPTMDNYLTEIFKVLKNNKNPTFLVGLKLPPYFDLHWYPQITEILKKYPIHFITCVNSIGNGLLVDSNSESTYIRPKGGMGGIGGKYIKPIGLSNVRNFYLEFQKQNLNIDIIGCGGIETGEDIFEYILCGAQAVQIGTQFYKEGINCFPRLKKELIDIMIKKSYKNLSDFRGKLKII
jgi:dihydroorotate dehydrogenase (fumarate)